jgi:hypothetical protein
LSTRRPSSTLPPPLHPRPRLRRQTLPPPGRLVLRARHPPLVSRARPRPRRQLDPLPLALLLPALATCSLLRPRCELADMSIRPVQLALLVGTIRRTVSPTPGLEVYLTDMPRLTPVDPAGSWTERTRKDAGTSSDSPPRRMLTGSLRTGPDTYGHYYVRKQSTLKEWSRIMLWIAAMFAALVLIVLCLRFGSAVAPGTYLQSLRRKAVANEPPFAVSPPFASPNAISVLSYALIAWIVYGIVHGNASRLRKSTYLDTPSPFSLYPERSSSTSTSPNLRDHHLRTVTPTKSSPSSPLSSASPTRRLTTAVTRTHKHRSTYRGPSRIPQSEAKKLTKSKSASKVVGNAA